jgi:hypothetical protein
MGQGAPAPEAPAQANPLVQALMGGGAAPQAAPASMGGGMPAPAPMAGGGAPTAPQGGNAAIIEQLMRSPDPASQRMGMMLVEREMAQQKQAQEQARLAAAAEAAGIDPRLMADPALARAVLAQQNGGGAGGDATMGLNPIFGEDAEGNPVILQLSNRGGASQAPLPEGVQIRRDPIRVDAGTQVILLDPITRQQIGSIPKENEAAAADTARGSAIGRAQGEAMTDAPRAVVQADTILADVDALINDPGLDNTVGWGSFVPFDIPGFNAETRSRLNKLEGQAFLQAFESLKGGGQITEIEGQKATQAMARLGRAQRPEEFRQALREFREVIAAARDRSARRLPQEPASSAGAPVPGSQSVAPGNYRWNPETNRLEPM